MNAVKLGLWPKVSSLVILLGVLNTGSLCSLGNLSLCLSGRDHEGDQAGLAALAGARGLTALFKPLSRDFGDPMGDRRPIGERPIAGAT